MPKSITPPEPPKFLSLDAKLKWIEVWRVLDPQRFDPVTHADYVSIYCQSWVQWKEAIEKLDIEGPLAKGAGGGVVANPYVAIRDEAAQALLKVGENLGLRPDAALAPVTQWDVVVEVLGGGGGGYEDDGE